MNALILGLGRMGLRHVQVVRDLGLTLAGGADVAPAAREKAASDFGLSTDQLFEDPLEAINKTHADIVVVATTAPSHCELVCAAAKAGAKFILCEKPLAVSLAECDRMIETCRRTGTHLAVNHQMRFMEQYTRPKQIVDSAAFGGLGSMTVVAGNFGMGMNGSHYFEAFRFIASEKPATVAAWFSDETLANPRGPQFEDRAGSIRLTTRSGKRFYMDASTDQGHGMHVTYAGPFGRLDVDELGGTMTVVVRQEEHRSFPTTRYGMPWTETREAIQPADAVMPTRAVMSALLAGQDYPDGETGRMAVEILVAAYLSHEDGGRTVNFETETLPRDRVFPWA